MAQILDSGPFLIHKKIETWAGTKLDTFPVPTAHGQRIIPNASISVNFSVFCLWECADFDLARCSIQNLKLLQASEFILCPIFPFLKVVLRGVCRALFCAAAISRKILRKHLHWRRKDKG